MANEILAGAVFNAGQVIAGVDANNPPYVGPPPMTVGWSNAGLSESERVAPAANGMQLYRHDQPYTNAHPNRTLHNLPEYLEGLPFTVESSSPYPENGIEGTPNSLEEYTFNTSGTLYLILRADWGGYEQNPMRLQQLNVPTSNTNIGTGVLDPSAWTSVEDSVGYMGGGGDYGTYVFSKSVEAGTHSLNNLYHYAFKIDPPPPQNLVVPSNWQGNDQNTFTVSPNGDIEYSTDGGPVKLIQTLTLPADTTISVSMNVASDNISPSLNHGRHFVIVPTGLSAGSTPNHVIANARDAGYAFTSSSTTDQYDTFGAQMIAGPVPNQPFNSGGNFTLSWYNQNEMSVDLVIYQGNTDDEYGGHNWFITDLFVGEAS